MIISKNSLFKIIQFKPKKVLFKKVEDEFYAVVHSQTKIWLKIEVEDFDLDNVLVSFHDINEINVLMFEKIEFKNKMVYFDDITALKPRIMKEVEYNENKPQDENLKEFLPHELVKSSYLLNKAKKIIISKNYVNMFSERLSIHYPINLELKHNLEVLDTDDLLRFLNASFLKQSEILFTIHSQGLTFSNGCDSIEVQCKIIKDIKESDLTLFEYKNMSSNGFLFNTKDMLTLEINSKGTFLKSFYWMQKISENSKQMKNLYFNSQTFNDANFLIPFENNEIAVVENGLIIKANLEKNHYFVRLYQM